MLKTLYNIHGPAFVNENGTVSDVTFGKKITVIEDHVKSLDKGLVDLLYQVRVDVEDASTRDKALRELEMVREALQAIQQGEKSQKHSALQVLSRFGDHLKEGTSGTVKALKTIKDGGDAINWLMEKVPFFIAELVLCFT